MMTNPSIKLATMFTVAVALATVGTTATSAFAQSDDQSGIEIADQLIHQADEPEEGQQVSDTDLAFHQSLCLAGISTEALDELGGCEALPPLGQDDDE
jgi:hypothetical protein